MESDIKTELLKYGFATVDYPKNVTGIVQNAMEAWQKFCQLPLETKSRFVYTGDYGTGYEYKDEIGETKDRKENFHFILNDVSRLAQISKESGIDSDSFIFNSTAFISGIEDCICSFAGVLEKEFNLAGLENEVRQSKGAWLLRYLHYFPGSPVDKTIAAHHCDKFGLTMYLTETTFGVQYYSKNGEWISMPVLSGKTVVTPDLQLQYKTTCGLKALYHRVVANDVSSVEGRWSIVCFIPFLKTPFSNKERIGRMQDMPLAFNYDMQFEDFSKLFI